MEVINDAAGRSVQFGSNYNEILTTKEPQQQSILQDVKRTRKTFVTSKQTFFNRIACFWPANVKNILIDIILKKQTFLKNIGFFCF